MGSSPSRREVFTRCWRKYRTSPQIPTNWLTIWLPLWASSSCSFPCSAHTSTMSCPSSSDSAQSARTKCIPNYFLKCCAVSWFIPPINRSPKSVSQMTQGPSRVLAINLRRSFHPGSLRPIAFCRWPWWMYESGLRLSPWQHVNEQHLSRWQMLIDDFCNSFLRGKSAERKSRSFA
jgi:hypothetical protein